MLTPVSAPHAALVVLIEKPLTPTHAEAVELVNLAKEKNVILAPFQNRRWDADFLAVKGLLKEEKVSRSGLVFYPFLALFEVKRSAATWVLTAVPRLSDGSSDNCWSSPRTSTGSDLSLSLTRGKRLLVS